ncbi:MAG: putative bifunctional diguanylate cyclase/phosphodiesterase, partial [Gammaproteobacteria bacterium]
MAIFVPALWMASGVCLFAGIHFTFTGLPRSQDRVYLAFGILSLLLAGYLLLKALLYHPGSLDTVRSVVRWQLTLTCLIYPVALWFLSLYTGLRRWHGWVIGTSVIFGVLLFINLSSPNSVIYTDIVPRASITLPWGETIEDYLGVPSHYAWVYHIAVNFVFLWAIWRCIAMWRAGQRTRALPLVTYLLIQFAVTLQVEYVIYTGSNTVTLDAFTFVALVVLMSDALRREQQKRSDALVTSLADLNAETRRREEVESSLRHMAYHDQLTDLPNRRLLRERLKDALTQAHASGEFGALIQLDLDHFKTINDSLGHNLGDELLRKISERIQATSSGSRCIARLGGDEFAVLVTELDAGRDAAQKHTDRIARDLTSRLTAPFHIGDHELTVGVSAGIAIFPGDADDEDSVLRQADMALYSAKTAGRNTTVLFAGRMQDDVNRRLFLEKGLRQAIDRQELQLHYQPQLDAHGYTIGAEALLRWHHPEYGYINPAEFIPIAEETGLIHTIGKLVLREACNMLRTWSAADGKSSRLSVNISPWQLFAPDFVRTVTDTVQATGADPRRLTLEITENAFLHDLEDAAAKIRMLDTFGIRFSIDDFGSGYSSLASLKKLPLRELKIDQAFIHEMSLEPRDRFIEAM